MNDYLFDAGRGKTRFGLAEATRRTDTMANTGRQFASQTYTERDGLAQN